LNPREAVDLGLGNCIIADTGVGPAPDDSGLTVVDVSVPSGQAADLAARVATGRIALILDSRER